MKKPVVPAEASIYFVPEGYATGGRKLMGRHAAGEGFLQAWVSTHGGDTLSCCVASEAHAREFLKMAQAIRPGAQVRWHGFGAAELPEGCGTIYLPGPDIAEQARLRAAHGSQRYSLCGVTHTISSQGAQESLRSLVTAPVEPWDAVICTSTVVKAAVERLLDEEEDRLRTRLGAGRFVRPLLPIIPLGVDTRRYRHQPEARLQWRRQLGIAEDDVAFLFVGRLSFHAKAHPLQMFQALHEAVKQLGGKRLHLILAGWFANEPIERAFREGAKDFCPQVVLHVVDARAEQSRFSIWSAADVFLSLSDNYQETFGLTPLEAMATELPVLATDWNGYRDTIPDGVVGYRIPTISAPAGGAADLAYQHQCGDLDYDYYSGHTCQFVAADLGACVEKIVALVRSPQLRRDMGKAARQHAESHFDWRKVLEQYRQLWLEQYERRLAGVAKGEGSKPYLQFPDPCALFRDYPSAVLQPGTRLKRAANDGLSLAACRQHLLLRYGMGSLLPEAPMNRLFDAVLADAPTSVEQLAQRAALPLSAPLFRTLLWFVKVGLVTVV